MNRDIIKQWSFPRKFLGSTQQIRVRSETWKCLETLQISEFGSNCCPHDLTCEPAQACPGYRFAVCQRAHGGAWEQSEGERL